MPAPVRRSDGYAPVADLRSAIAFWPGPEPGDPADMLLLVLVPPEEEDRLNWPMVRRIAKTELEAVTGRPAVIWPPPSERICTHEGSVHRFSLLCGWKDAEPGGRRRPPDCPSPQGGGQSSGLVFNYRQPHA